MARKGREMDRRVFLTAGAGLVVLVGGAGSAQAAELTAAERANVQLVNDFCAAFPSHDLGRVMAFFAEDGAYRMTETTELAKGRDAVSARVQSILDRVESFEVLDTWARGPMVINERIDRLGNVTWHGVGVFFIQGGKIVDWYDYTIALERD